MVILSNPIQVHPDLALRRRLAGKEGDPESAEQLIDLLEKLGMRQITLLSRRPITFLLLNLSDVVPAQEWLLDVAMLQKYASLLGSESDRV